jgi:hypothetical protein
MTTITARKCPCNHCGITIEFDPENVGEEVLCPNCNSPTILFKTPERLVAKAAQEPPMFGRGVYAFAFAAVLCIAIAATALVIKDRLPAAEANPAAAGQSESRGPAILPPPDAPPTVSGPVKLPHIPEPDKIESLAAKPWLMSEEEKQTRDSLLKSLLDVQAATHSGVSMSKYSELVSGALASFNYATTKLSAGRHEKYLAHAKEAIELYDQAKSEWSHTLKMISEYDSGTEVWMSQANFDDLRAKGVTVETAKLRKNDQGYYVVPLDDCLDYYWLGADRFVGKMRNDVEP